MGVRNIIRVPVTKYVCEYLLNFYPSKNDRPFIDLTEKDFIHTSIINFIKVYGKDDENFIPSQRDPFVYLQTSMLLGLVGLNEENAGKLGILLKKYVYGKFCEDVLFYSSLPGISVTEAILTVLAKYDIVSYEIDSFRRQFDRATRTKKVKIDIYTVHQRVNKSLKSIYNEKFTKYLNDHNK